MYVRDILNVYDLRLPVETCPYERARFLASPPRLGASPLAGNTLTARRLLWVTFGSLVRHFLVTLGPLWGHFGHMMRICAFRGPQCNKNTHF